MMALGSGTTIVGGDGPDQLGVLGRNATIDGGAGNDLIHGGPGHDVIYGGGGNDLTIDTMGSATICTGSGRDEVDVAGHAGGRDRVLCAAGQSIGSSPIAAITCPGPVTDPGWFITGPRPRRQTVRRLRLRMGAPTTLP
jgi:Ca2+-binding RTX toxin-like protein